MLRSRSALGLRTASVLTASSSRPSSKHLMRIPSAKCFPQDFFEKNHRKSSVWSNNNRSKADSFGFTFMEVPSRCSQPRPKNIINIKGSMKPLLLSKGSNPKQIQKIRRPFDLRIKSPGRIPVI